MMLKLGTQGPTDKRDAFGRVSEYWPWRDRSQGEFLDAVDRADDDSASFEHDQLGGQKILVGREKCT